ncbi:MAG: SUMF1/EgtB/PvdO family nonheme iron enzyme [Anaerolineae bacterium]|nr:SUMF1/EgtB/PvdO family nonheme iron enzyme [Anaerolineae bacterium]
MHEYTGMTIDRYQVLERRGTGGMAVVYHGYDTRLERDVAIKLIRTENIAQSEYENMLMRFEREAKAQARFSHPNIVPIYDYGKIDGVPYLVMDFIEGGTLKELVGKPMALDRVVALTLPVADALDYAHQQHVIHRDVKPSNILMKSPLRPMLTDFGIAKILETDLTTLTGSGVGVGTPEYMAPEQWKGKVYPQTDMYALAVVVYEMLTGTRPYHADTPAAVAIQQATDPLPKPTRQRLDLPKSADDFLLRALAYNPTERFATMEEFKAGLYNLLPSSVASVYVVKDSSARQEDQARNAQNDPDFTDLSHNSEAVDIQPSHALPAYVQKPANRKKAWLVVLPVLLLVILAGALLLQGKPFLAAFAGRTSTATITATATSAPATPTVASATPAPMPTRTDAPTATATIPSMLVREQDGMEMVYISAGEFNMGYAGGEEDESYVHPVYLDAYWIDRFEVTNAQYQACVSAGECSLPNRNRSYLRTDYYLSLSYADYPVIHINWHQAAAYCAWAGGRLPTEAEWEKAARGISDRIYPWGDEAPACTLANKGGCVGDTSQVGSFPDGASPYGVMDMAGNVWEWVADWYGADAYSQSMGENPPGPAVGTLRVIRGGSWGDGADQMRVSDRSWSDPDSRWGGSGVRCVVPIP